MDGVHLLKYKTGEAHFPLRAAFAVGEERLPLEGTFAVGSALFMFLRISLTSMQFASDLMQFSYNSA